MNNTNDKRVTHSGDAGVAHSLYRQVAQQIADEIKSGKYPVNTKIPSERDLAEQFDISRMTIRAAIDTLVHQGLVVRRRRSGTYVAHPRFQFDLSSRAGLHTQLQDAGITPGAKVIVAEQVLAGSVDAEIMNALQLKEQDGLYRIVRLRTANDEPIVVENSYFPATLFPDLLDYNLTGSLYGILKKHFSFESSGAVQEITISHLDTESADLMGVAADLATLEIKRRAFTTNEAPFEFAHDIYLGDRIAFAARTVGPALNLGIPDVANLVRDNE